MARHASLDSERPIMANSVSSLPSLPPCDVTPILTRHSSEPRLQEVLLRQRIPLDHALRTHRGQPAQRRPQTDRHPPPGRRPGTPGEQAPPEAALCPHRREDGQHEQTGPGRQGRACPRASHDGAGCGYAEAGAQREDCLMLRYHLSIYLPLAVWTCLIPFA